MSTPILDKIAKVLAKAESTDNEHEADAFLAQAQRMATAHAIDLAVARRHVAKSRKREEPIQRTIHIGAPRAMGNAKMVNLFLTVARNNDVTCNIAHNSTYVIAYGFPSDIEVTEALYAHLAYQMVESSVAYLRSGEFRDEAVWDERSYTFKPASAKTARLGFYDAFTARIGHRLYEARTAAEAAAARDSESPTDGDAAQEQSEGASTALVLADKRAEVKDFYSKNSNARGSWQGGRRRTATVRSAHQAGDAAGARARLAAQPVLPGGKKQIGA